MPLSILSFGPRFRPSFQIALTDPQRLSDPYAALAKLPKHSVLIWRLFGASPKRRELSALRDAAHQRHCHLLIAGHGDQHAWTICDGLHLPEHALLRHPIALPRRPGQIITAAAHCERALFAAKRAEVDAVLISPVFETSSHQNASGLGIIHFAKLAKQAQELGLHVFALGGVTKANKNRLSQTAINAFAGIDWAKQL